MRYVSGLMVLRLMIVCTVVLLISDLDLIYSLVWLSIGSPNLKFFNERFVISKLTCRKKIF